MQITKRAPVKHLMCGINPVHSSELSNAFQHLQKKKNISVVVLPPLDLQKKQLLLKVFSSMFHYSKLLKKQPIF